MRLWLFRDEVTYNFVVRNTTLFASNEWIQKLEKWFTPQGNMFILEEEESTLDELGILDEDQILIEVRNKDLTWPEELSSIACNNSNDKRQGKTSVKHLDYCFVVSWIYLCCK